MTRPDLETTALLLLGTWAQRQLGAPKNRAKGSRLPDLSGCIRASQEELDEALHALRAGLGHAAVMAELGDAAAWCGLAMVVAVRGEHG